MTAYADVCAWDCYPSRIVESRRADTPAQARRMCDALRRAYPFAAVTIEVLPPKTKPGPEPRPTLTTLITTEDAMSAIDHTDPEPEVAPTTPTTPTAAEQAEDSDRRTRRKRVASVEIADELHALATLTGRDPAEIIQSIVAARLGEIRQQAARVLSEAVR
jgi:hypothetical protein